MACSIIAFFSSENWTFNDTTSGSAVQCAAAVSR